MSELNFDEAPVAAKDRISVDISDIKQRIEDCRNEPAWRELSLAGKLRALVIERLEELEKRKEND
jgi:hypothetical protein